LISYTAKRALFLQKVEGVRDKIATQTGPMGPFPASGKKMILPFMAILRFSDGKIAEMWVEWDNLNALAQSGHFPPPE